MQSTRGGMQWTRREHLSMYSRKRLAGLRSRVATSSSVNGTSQTRGSATGRRHSLHELYSMPPALMEDIADWAEVT